MLFSSFKTCTSRVCPLPLYLDTHQSSIHHSGSNFRNLSPQIFAQLRIIYSKFCSDVSFSDSPPPPVHLTNHHCPSSHSDSFFFILHVTRSWIIHTYAYCYLFPSPPSPPTLDLIKHHESKD